jgi:hypothetical protein
MKVHNHSLLDVLKEKRRKRGRKTLYIKMKDKNLFNKITRKKRAQLNTTQRKKNESQQSTKNKEKKTLCKYDPKL